MLARLAARRWNLLQAAPLSGFQQLCGKRGPGIPNHGIRFRQHRLGARETARKTAGRGRRAADGRARARAPAHADHHPMDRGSRPGVCAALHLFRPGLSSFRCSLRSPSSARRCWSISGPRSGRRATERLSDRAAAAYLGFDLLQLAALLYLTGGLHNPFALLILAPITVSATILSRVQHHRPGRAGRGDPGHRWPATICRCPGATWISRWQPLFVAGLAIALGALDRLHRRLCL